MPRFVLGLVAAAVLAVAGCSSSKGVQAEVPAGFKVVHNSGFSVAIPNTWSQLPLQSPDVSTLTTQLLQLNPALKGTLDQVAALKSSGGALLALDPVKGDSFNVIIRSGVGNTKIDDVVEPLKRQYQSINGKVNTTEHVKFAGNDAVHVSAELPSGASTAATIHEDQYLTIHSDKVFILTLVGRAPELATVVKTFTLS